MAGFFISRLTASVLKVPVVSTYTQSVHLRHVRTELWVMNFESIHRQEPSCNSSRDFVPLDIPHNIPLQNTNKAALHTFQAEKDLPVKEKKSPASHTFTVPGRIYQKTNRSIVIGGCKETTVN